MSTIKSIPNQKGLGGSYWTQTDECAGFKVGNDCPWRYEEMELIAYTPTEC